MKKVFYRVTIILNENTDEEDRFSFDFSNVFKAAAFADEAFRAEMAYDRVYMECREYDPSDMTTCDAPCWREVVKEDDKQ